MNAKLTMFYVRLETMETAVALLKFKTRNSEVELIKPSFSLHGFADLQISYCLCYIFCFVLFKKALTVLRGPLAYPNGLLDLHIETFCRTPGTGDQPDARPLPTQDNTTQKHADTHPCPKQDSNLRSQCSSDRRRYNP
jgi:hypothetical protein